MNEVAIKALPEGWQLVPLGTLRGGTAKSINPSDRPDEIYDLYSIPSYSEGIPEVVTGKEIGSSKRIVEPNTVLLSKINPRINRVWIVGSASKHKQISSPEWIEFFPIDGIEPKYIMYFMQNHKFREHLSMNVTGVGGSLTRIRPKIAEDYEIPLAPIEQQKRIVAKIEKLFSHIDAGIASLQAAKKLLKQYRQSVLKAAVTGELTKDWREANKDKLEPASQLLERILIERRQRWEEQQLEQFEARGKLPKDDKWKKKYKESNILDGSELDRLPNEWQWAKNEQLGAIQLGRQRSPKYHNGPNMRQYLRVQNVFENKIDLNDVMEMDFSQSDFEKYALEYNDILLNEGQSPEFLGRPAIYRNELPGVCFTNTLIRFQAANGVLPEYALLVYRHCMHAGRFTKAGTITTNIGHLSAGRFSQIEFPLCSSLEQEEVVKITKNIFIKIERLEKDIDVQKIKVKKNKQSILTFAFSGRLCKASTASS